MEIYNRYTDNDGYCHEYITFASTGKAAIVISGTTVHTAFKISLSRLLPLHSGTAQHYRTLFKYTKVIIIDEINNLVALHFKYDQARRRFVEWAQNEIAVAPDFHTRILFSDEAHFWLNGYVNKQNCRIWSEVNPQVYVETPLHPEKLTVWCALWAGGILLQKR
ncbi:ATP-dependent DNA helicase [Trichonephila clavipes]|nr:ATP-dependent DNA helicase [Trichonephila clavipes]